MTGTEVRRSSDALLIEQFDVKQIENELFAKFAPIWEVEEVDRLKQWTEFLTVFLDQGQLANFEELGKCCLHEAYSISKFEPPDSELKLKLDNLVASGLPCQIRGEAWTIFLDAHVRKQKDYYQHLVDRALDSLKNQDVIDTAALKAQSIALATVNAEESATASGLDGSPSGPAPPSGRTWLLQIEKDLPRTFPGLQILSGSGRLALRRVLAAYSLHNPRVGYCQGMNFIAGTLLLFMNEEDAFYCLCAVVEDVLAGYFSLNLLETQVDQRVFKQLVAAHLPHLSSAIAREDDGFGADISYVYLQWSLCLFVNFLPLETCLRVWDLLFYHRSSIVLFRFSLALLELYSPALLEARGVMEALGVVQQMAGWSFDARRLVHLAFSPALDEQLCEFRVASLRTAVRREILSEIEDREREGVADGGRRGAPGAKKERDLLFFGRRLGGDGAAEGGWMAQILASQQQGAAVGASAGGNSIGMAGGSGSAGVAKVSMMRKLFQNIETKLDKLASSNSNAVGAGNAPVSGLGEATLQSAAPAAGPSKAAGLLGALSYEECMAGGGGGGGLSLQNIGASLTGILGTRNTTLGGGGGGGLSGMLIRKMSERLDRDSATLLGGSRSGGGSGSVPQDPAAVPPPVVRSTSPSLLSVDADDTCRVSGVMGGQPASSHSLASAFASFASSLTARTAAVGNGTSIPPLDGSLPHLVDSIFGTIHEPLLQPGTRTGAQGPTAGTTQRVDEGCTAEDRRQGRCTDTPPGDVKEGQSAAVTTKGLPCTSSIGGGRPASKAKEGFSEEDREAFSAAVVHDASAEPGKFLPLLPNVSPGPCLRAPAPVSDPALGQTAESGGASDNALVAKAEKLEKAWDRDANLASQNATTGAEILIWHDTPRWKDMRTFSLAARVRLDEASRPVQTCPGVNVSPARATVREQPEVGGAPAPEEDLLRVMSLAGGSVTGTEIELPPPPAGTAAATLSSGSAAYRFSSPPKALLPWDKLDLSSPSASPPLISFASVTLPSAVVLSSSDEQRSKIKDEKISVLCKPAPTATACATGAPLAASASASAFASAIATVDDSWAQLVAPFAVFRSISPGTKPELPATPGAASPAEVAAEDVKKMGDVSVYATEVGGDSTALPSAPLASPALPPNDTAKHARKTAVRPESKALSRAAQIALDIAMGDAPAVGQCAGVTDASSATVDSGALAKPQLLLLDDESPVTASLLGEEEDVLLVDDRTGDRARGVLVAARTGASLGIPRPAPDASLSSALKRSEDASASVALPSRSETEGDRKPWQLLTLQSPAAEAAAPAPVKVPVHENAIPDSGSGSSKLSWSSYSSALQGIEELILSNEVMQRGIERLSGRAAATSGVPLAPPPGAVSTAPPSATGAHSKPLEEDVAEREREIQGGSGSGSVFGFASAVDVSPPSMVASAQPAMISAKSSGGATADADAPGTRDRVSLWEGSFASPGTSSGPPPPSSLASSSSGSCNPTQAAALVSLPTSRDAAKWPDPLAPSCAAVVPNPRLSSSGNAPAQASAVLGLLDELWAALFPSAFPSPSFVAVKGDSPAGAGSAGAAPGGGSAVDGEETAASQEEATGDHEDECLLSEGDLGAWELRESSGEEKSVGRILSPVKVRIQDHHFQDASVGPGHLNFRTEDTLGDFGSGSSECRPSAASRDDRSWTPTSARRRFLEMDAAFAAAQPLFRLLRDSVAALEKSRQESEQAAFAAACVAHELSSKVRALSGALRDQGQVEQALTGKLRETYDRVVRQDNTIAEKEALVKELTAIIDRMTASPVHPPPPSSSHQLSSLVPRNLALQRPQSPPPGSAASGRRAQEGLGEECASASVQGNKAGADVDIDVDVDIYRPPARTKEQENVIRVPAAGPAGSEASTPVVAPSVARRPRPLSSLEDGLAVPSFARPSMPAGAGLEAGTSLVPSLAGPGSASPATAEGRAGHVSSGVFAQPGAPGPPVASGAVAVFPPGSQGAVTLPSSRAQGLESLELPARLPLAMVQRSSATSHAPLPSPPLHVAAGPLFNPPRRQDLGLERDAGGFVHVSSLAAGFTALRERDENALAEGDPARSSCSPSWTLLDRPSTTAPAEDRPHTQSHAHFSGAMASVAAPLPSTAPIGGPFAGTPSAPPATGARAGSVTEQHDILPVSRLSSSGSPGPLLKKDLADAAGPSRPFTPPSAGAIPLSNVQGSNSSAAAAACAGAPHNVAAGAADPGIFPPSPAHPNAGGQAAHVPTAAPRPRAPLMGSLSESLGHQPAPDARPGFPGPFAGADVPTPLTHPLFPHKHAVTPHHAPHHALHHAPPPNRYPHLFNAVPYAGPPFQPPPVRPPPAAFTLGQGSPPPLGSAPPPLQMCVAPATAGSAGYPSTARPLSTGQRPTGVSLSNVPTPPVKASMSAAGANHSPRQTPSGPFRAPDDLVDVDLPARGGAPRPTVAETAQAGASPRGAAGIKPLLPGEKRPNVGTGAQEPHSHTEENGETGLSGAYFSIGGGLRRGGSDGGGGGGMQQPSLDVKQGGTVNRPMHWLGKLRDKIVNNNSNFSTGSGAPSPSGCAVPSSKVPGGGVRLIVNYKEAAKGVVIETDDAAPAKGAASDPAIGGGRKPLKLSGSSVTQTVKMALQKRATPGAAVPGASGGGERNLDRLLDGGDGDSPIGSESGEASGDGKALRLDADLLGADEGLVDVGEARFVGVGGHVGRSVSLGNFSQGHADDRGDISRMGRHSTTPPPPFRIDVSPAPAPKGLHPAPSRSSGPLPAASLPSHSSPSDFVDLGTEFGLAAPADSRKFFATPERGAALPFAPASGHTAPLAHPSTEPRRLVFHHQSTAAGAQGSTASPQKLPQQQQSTLQQHLLDM